MAFTATVIVNSINVSAKITGTIRVKGVEAGARIAVFVINPDAGVIDPYSYIGQSVTIDYVDGSTDRLFTGIVNAPAYDITTGLLTLGCTDNLQEDVELIDRAAINALLPYFWDKSVFNEPEDNWSYAEQVMSTYAGSFDKDVNGVVRVTDWQPKATPDFTYSDNTIIDNSLTTELSFRRNIVNSIKIDFSNRYQRQWQRELSDSWSLGIVFGAAWFANPTQYPTKEMIRQAASAWTIKNISFTDLPPSGLIDGTSWNLSLYAQTLAQAASISVAKRWVQNVTDNYSITIASAASIAAHGLLEIEQKHTQAAENSSQFTDFGQYKAPVGTLIEAGNYINLDALSTANAINTAVNLAKTKILSKHRNNFISFEAVLNAAVDLDKTIQINHTKAQGKGKVTEVEHTIDLLNGRAITACKVAIYLPTVAAQTEDALTVPASPYAHPSGLVNSFSGLSTYLGNIDGAVVEDPTWNGFIGNYEEWTGTPPAPEYYDTRFGFDIPEVTDTNAIEFNSTTSFNVAIPETPLVIIE